VREGYRPIEVETIAGRMLKGDREHRRRPQGAEERSVRRRATKERATMWQWSVSD
jgi:hypothetical protein